MGRIRISTKLGMPSLVVSEYVQKKRFSFVVRSMIPAKAGKSYIEVEAKTSVLWFRFLNMSVAKSGAHEFDLLFHLRMTSGGYLFF